MKTITLKVKADIPQIPKPKILVDGQIFGNLENKHTQYFEVPDDVRHFSLRIQGLKSNEIRISHKKHISLFINPQKSILYGVISNLIFIAAAYYICKSFDINFWVMVPITLVCAVIFYALAKNWEIIKLEEIES